MNAAYLIGFRGAGKSTFGKALAEEGICDFLDLDAQMEAAFGCSILEYVDEHGLESFRRQEEAHLRNADLQARSRMEGKPLLVGLGGGVVDWAPSLEILSNSPIPRVWIEVEALEAWNRLESAPDRRKIGGLNSRNDLENLFRQRHPYYEKIASYKLKNRDISQGLSDLKLLLQRIWPSKR